MILARAMHVGLCAARELLCSPHEPNVSIEQVAARVNVSPFHLP